jgi:hypothetical protein
MDQGPDSKKSLLLSYFVLRKAIGIIGCALPFTLLVGGCLLEGRGIQPSVSYYYYTGMRNVFVGSLFAIGVFLMSYRGYEEDKIPGRLASLCAIGVSLLPTAPYPCPTSQQKYIGVAHLICAALFFSSLAYFSLHLFIKTDQAPRSDQKVARDRVYRRCGWTIVGCLISIAVVKLIGFCQRPFEAATERWRLDFWFEAAAIVAFGVSWLTKGQAIHKDQKA